MRKTAVILAIFLTVIGSEGYKTGLVDDWDLTNN